jgi:hypothetical protein
MPSTNDPVSHDPDMRLRDELALSFRLPLAQFGGGLLIQRMIPESSPNVSQASYECDFVKLVSYRLTLDAFCKKSIAIERAAVPPYVGRNGLNLNGSFAWHPLIAGIIGRM